IYSEHVMRMREMDRGSLLLISPRISHYCSIRPPGFIFVLMNRRLRESSEASIPVIAGLNETMLWAYQKELIFFEREKADMPSITPKCWLWKLDLRAIPDLLPRRQIAL
ncbi:MAG: hypothetical protein SWE60_21630, partial [Thermodesulfobacteriota bacterium]|nr:hypothetical protein [Thermodesulfobacteriota bacterium]